MMAEISELGFRVRNNFLIFDCSEISFDSCIDLFDIGFIEHYYPRRNLILYLAEWFRIFQTVLYKSRGFFQKSIDVLRSCRYSIDPWLTLHAVPNMGGKRVG